MTEIKTDSWKHNAQSNCMKQFVSIGFTPTALRFELNYRTDITAAIITLSHYTDKKKSLVVPTSVSFSY
jgi:hypothetical protein